MNFNNYRFRTVTMTKGKQKVSRTHLVVAFLMTKYTSPGVVHNFVVILLAEK